MYAQQLSHPYSQTLLIWVCIDGPKEWQFLHNVEEKWKLNILMFESLCTACTSMFSPLIWRKIKEIDKFMHAHHLGDT